MTWLTIMTWLLVLTFLAMMVEQAWTTHQDRKNDRDTRKAAEIMPELPVKYLLERYSGLLIKLMSIGPDDFERGNQIEEEYLNTRGIINLMDRGYTTEITADEVQNRIQAAETELEQTKWLREEFDADQIKSLSQKWIKSTVIS